MAQLLTPEKLLAQAARNDPAAMAELYDRLAPGLLGMLARMLTRREVAEEVLQEVFVRLWEEARSLAPSGGSVAAWLVVAARALALERLREQRSSPGGAAKSPRGEKARAARARIGTPRAVKPRTDPPLIADSLTWLPRPEDIARLDDRRELLRKVVGQLPKTQEEALELALFGGYTDVEIAEQLGEPLGKVTSSLQAAVTFLRHRLHAVLGTWTANV